MDDFEILFGGYATPPECEAFWRLALNSYIQVIIQSQAKFHKSDMECLHSYG